jgi:hypothetical protein
MMDDHLVDANYQFNRVFNVDIEGEGSFTIGGNNIVDHAVCSSCTTSGAVNDLPAVINPETSRLKTTLIATPAAGWVFAGWAGDSHIDGMTDSTIVNTYLDPTSYLTARFVQCNGAFSLFKSDLSDDCYECPPTGWSQSDIPGAVVRKEDGRHYLTKIAKLPLPKARVIVQDEVLDENGWKTYYSRYG